MKNSWKNRVFFKLMISLAIVLLVKSEQWQKSTQMGFEDTIAV